MINLHITEALRRNEKTGIVGTKYLEKAAMIRNERIWHEDRSNIGYGFRNRKK